MTNPAFAHREENPFWVLRPWQRRAYGFGVLIVIAAFVALSVASYEKAFTRVTFVYLETDHTGMQLLQHSDVKLRGIIVGDVHKISTYVVTGPSGDKETRARLQLALKPNKTRLIPRGVTALLLPKTLFGEKYVALQIPTTLSSDQQRPIRAGDTITQATASIELEQVLSDIYPLLLALHPEDLRNTLTALATALAGRGKELGQNLELLDTYLHSITPVTPQLTDDLVKLGQVASEYNDAAPDLIGLLSNLETTNQTLVSHHNDLHALLRKATDTAGDLQNFLTTNGDALIRVAADSEPALALLDRYSPEYPCLLAALTRLEPNEEGAFGGIVPGLHITLEIVKDQGAYVQGEQFRYPFEPSIRYPKCLRLPNPPVPWPGASYESTPYDGAVANRNPTALRSAYSQTVVGSAAEDHLLALLASPSFGHDPASVPDVTKLLLAPLVRGTAVTLQ